MAKAVRIRSTCTNASGLRRFYNGSRGWVAVGAMAALAAAPGCGGYADFSLPRLTGHPERIRLRWEVISEPVLRRGVAGAWDGVDALNPSVVQHNGLYHNFYSGYDGRTWHTGLAISADGRNWERKGRILSPGDKSWEGQYIAANGSALWRDGRFLYWYQAGAPPRVGLARSADGRNWLKEPNPVLPLGPNGSWDERGVADPYVLEVGGRLYMYYLGQDRARRQRLGLARSSDGLRWEKLRQNPILELGPRGSFDENGLGEPAVWPSHGLYWMLYTGRDRLEVRRLGLAWSRDGVRWTRYSDAAFLAGQEDWNSKVVCDPAVETTTAGARVWFGGGDVAHPAENIHGQIGLATLHMEVR